MLAQEVKKKIARHECVNGKNIQLRRKFNLATFKGGKAEVEKLGKEIPFTPVFCDDDYNSGDGFLTGTWGPLQWHFLHIISFNYRPEKEHEYRNYLRSMAAILPCRHCRENFASNHESAKNRLSREFGMEIYESRESFSRFIYLLHSEVNRMLKKDTTHEPTYDVIKDEIEGFRSRCMTRKEAEKSKKEAGCLESAYDCDAKPHAIVTFRPREKSEIDKVCSLRIADECRIKKAN